VTHMRSQCNYILVPGADPFNAITVWHTCEYSAICDCSAIAVWHMRLQCDYSVAHMRLQCNYIIVPGADLFNV